MIKEFKWVGYVWETDCTELKRAYKKAKWDSGGIIHYATNLIAHVWRKRTEYRTVKVEIVVRLLD